MAADPEPTPGSRVVALIPCRLTAPAEELLSAIAEHVGQIVIVDDGLPAAERRSAELLAAGLGGCCEGGPPNRGKGTALALALNERGEMREAAIILDGDGQHPADAIPSFLAAGAAADLVVGDRSAGMNAAPLIRQLSIHRCDRARSASRRHRSGGRRSPPAARSQTRCGDGASGGNP